MKIQCELTIEPGEGSRQSRYTLSVATEVVFQKYEQDMTPAEKELVSMVTWGNGRHMDRISERLRVKPQ